MALAVDQIFGSCSLWYFPHTLLLWTFDGHTIDEFTLASFVPYLG